MREAAKEHVQTIGLAAQLEHWAALLDWLQKFGGNCQLPAKLQASLQLVCEEWFMNIVHYGFKNRSDSDSPYIQVVARTSVYAPKKVWILFIDNGSAFNPLRYLLPNINLPEHNRPIGGLGIYFIRKKTRSCRYNRAGSYNYFTMELEEEGGNKQ